MKKVYIAGLIIATSLCGALMAPQAAIQAQQIIGIIQGFNRSEWEQSRPERMCRYIKSHLEHGNKQEVLSLLGRPDKDSAAGEGMWGPYLAQCSYILDRYRDAESGEIQNGYVWHELTISFDTRSRITDFEITSHAY